MWIFTTMTGLLRGILENSEHASPLAEIVRHLGNPVLETHPSPKQKEKGLRLGKCSFWFGRFGPCGAHRLRRSIEGRVAAPAHRAGTMKHLLGAHLEDHIQMSAHPNAARR